MKKLLAGMMVAALMSGSFGVVAQASSVEELRNELVAIGVPSELANNVVNYLQTIELTEKDAAFVQTKVEAAYALVKDVTDLTTLPTATKNQLVSLANEAAGVLGLTIKYDIVNGVDTITLVTANGQSLGSLNTLDIVELVQNFGSESGTGESILGDLADLIIDVLQDGSGEFKPTPDDDLNDSGFAMSTMALAGLAVMGSGVTLAVKNRRK